MRNLLKKFLKDTRANIAITTGIMAVPMLLSVGVGLDTAEMFRAKTAYQAAVDAAALGAAKVLTTTGSATAAQSYGKKIFDANVGDMTSSEGEIDIDVGNGNCSGDGVIATANLRHRMFFDGLHKFYSDQGDADHLNLKITSTVKCGSDSVEIALVLDNSGSMGDNGKLNTLKNAANDLVDSVHDSMGTAQGTDPVRFSIVPFASMVNVGANNRNAAWMDTLGQAPYHNEHLDWASDPEAVSVAGVWRKTDGTPLTRFTLYDEMGIDWAGCVEQREYPHNTQDPTASSSDPETLIVPAFAPDTPDNYSGRREETHSTSTGNAYWCVRWGWGWSGRGQCREWNDGTRGSSHPVAGYANRYGGDYDYWGNYIGAGGGGSVSYGSRIQEESYYNNYLDDGHNPPGDLPIALNPTYTGTGKKQYSRQRWTWKYFNTPNPRNINDNRSGLPTVIGLPGGPNAWCTSQELLALTTSKSNTHAAINSMMALGATNVHQGISWGWKALSNRAPLSEGRPASAPHNKKIMIVMTDGNNTYYPTDEFSNSYSTRNPAFYSSWGHNGGRYEEPLESRLFAGYSGSSNPNHDFDTYREAMDERMVETCQNAKADGIQIYSIAFDVPQNSTVLQKLQQCASTDASGNPLYYPAENNAELMEAFDDIAVKIAEISITK